MIVPTCTVQDYFPTLLASVQHQAERCLALGYPFVQMATARPLWENYLAALPPAMRQEYTCHSCKAFIEHYGAIAAIGPTGEMEPLCWPGKGPDGPFAPLYASMRTLMHRARVAGPFVTDQLMLGLPQSPPSRKYGGKRWTHLALAWPWDRRHRNGLLSATQQAAFLREEYHVFCRNVAAYPQALAQQALACVESGHLARNEKVQGVASWLVQLHERLATIPHSIPLQRERLLWHAALTAPLGYVHLQSTMIGTLLDDLAAGRDFATCQQRFAAKMHPLRYQRPQAPPTDGQIARGEAIIQQLGLASALRRRFARAEELTYLWEPSSTPTQQTSGVFAHLRAAGQHAQGLSMPRETMSWYVFARDILPKALTIHACIPAHGDFVAYLTAVDVNDPPILQWDTPERRNPVSLYRYHNGSSCQQWGLTAGTWVAVRGIVDYPAHWGEQLLSHFPHDYVAILEGCVDSATDSGNGLFPEILIAPLREIRATIEAYSRTATITGRAEASACGLSVFYARSAVTFRVTLSGIERTIQIDREE